MKKSKIKLIAIGIILLIIILAVIISIIVSKFSKDNNIDNNIIYVNDIPQEVTVDSEDDIVLADEEGVIGTLEIPKIGVSAPIKEGTDWETMKEYIGHFENTKKETGNIGLAAHNRGYKVNYFQNIKNLKLGDRINYFYNGKKYIYEVYEKRIILDTDWTVLENKKNELTLITCVENKDEYRRCIKAKKIYNSEDM